MSLPDATFINMDENKMVDFIKTAKKRLVFISPGTTIKVAEAIRERWEAIGTDAVNVILDVDPEIYRMGYGDINALKFLEETAQKKGVMVHHQPGLRIGIIVADEVSLIFTPVPLLIEAGSKQTNRTNAIKLNSIPAEVKKEVGLSEYGVRAQTIGLDKVPSKDIQKIEEDIKNNPPVKIDVENKVRVFNSQFEFVEFELKGFLINRKTVQIPSDLMGLANDEKVQKLLKSTFKLVDNEGELSSDNLYKIKQKIVEKYLIQLPSYGTVILRKNKPKFERSVEALRRWTTCFQKKIKNILQKSIDNNRDALVTALLPSVVNNPPKRWNKYLNNKTKEEIKNLLVEELNEKFGLSDDILEQMKVSLLYKGVTYESLNDPKFVATAKKAIPSLKVLFEEFDAAKASK